MEVQRHSHVRGDNFSDRPMTRSAAGLPLVVGLVFVVATFALLVSFFNYVRAGLKTGRAARLQVSGGSSLLDIIEHNYYNMIILYLNNLI